MGSQLSAKAALLKSRCPADLGEKVSDSKHGKRADPESSGGAKASAESRIRGPCIKRDAGGVKGLRGEVRLTSLRDAAVIKGFK